MRENQWFSKIGSRLGLALLGALAVTTLFAEGIFDNPWISLFTMPPGIDEGLEVRYKLVLLLMAPVLGYLVAPRIQWLRDLLIIFTICCLMVSGLDLLLRLPKPKSDTQLYAWWLPRLPWIWRMPPNLDFRAICFGDLAGRTNDLNLREPRTIILQTDAAGFRNIHDGKGIDLLVMGDSFGAGFGTTQDHIFPRLLETQYGRHVYNLSLPGGPYQEYINFLLELPSMTFRPNAEVLWVFFTGNDLYDSSGDVWDPAALPFQDRRKALVTIYKNYRDRSPLRRLIIAVSRHLFGDSREQIVIRRELPNKQPILFHTLYEEAVNLSKTMVKRHSNFPKIERTMVEMRNRAAEHGLTLTVMLIPAKEELYRWILEHRERKPDDADPSGFALAVLDACQRLQIRCLDVKPYLTAETYRLFDSSGKLLYWRDDTHVNDSGHEAITTFIAHEILREKNQIPVQSQLSN
jgi:hypothetical protein